MNIVYIQLGILINRFSLWTLFGAITPSGLSLKGKILLFLEKYSLFISLLSMKL